MRELRGVNRCRDRAIPVGSQCDVIDAESANAVFDGTGDGINAFTAGHVCPESHTDQTARLGDELITEAGGLIGVGFWADVTCGEGVDAIASAIKYGVGRFGVDHIALGSDWDGSVTTPIDASQLPHLTQALLDAGLTESEVRAVMGGNMARFLAQHLPPG